MAVSWFGFSGALFLTEPPAFFFVLIIYYFWLCRVLVAVCRLGWPMACGILVPLTGDGTHAPCIGRWFLKHWTTRREVLSLLL